MQAPDIGVFLELCNVVRARASLKLAITGSCLPLRPAKKHCNLLGRHSFLVRVIHRVERAGPFTEDWLTYDECLCHTLARRASASKPV